MNKFPNSKQKLVNAKELGKDERVDLILNDPTSSLALLYKACDEIRASKMKKGYIEACLFCSDDVERISDILEIDLEVIKVYQEFFFDVRGWDRLSKVEHTDAIPDSRQQEMMLKLYALSNGLDFIAWRLGKSTSISPVEGLQELFNVCMYKSKEAMYNPSTSKTSMESTKWVKLSTDISRLLKIWVMDSSAAKRDLEIAIRDVLPEFKGIDSILSDEELDQLTEMNQIQQVSFGSIDSIQGND